jgi:hypothetical protein
MVTSGDGDLAKYLQFHQIILKEP